MENDTSKLEKLNATQIAILCLLEVDGKFDTGMNTYQGGQFNRLVTLGCIDENDRITDRGRHMVEQLTNVYLPIKSDKWIDFNDIFRNVVFSKSQFR